ncbi:MAG: hypothetical protein IT442_17955 [Phycisphaeraceae bacterium]|nr:hypothetical protein [Phycisphaeraceae bacterium]
MVRMKIKSLFFDRPAVIGAVDRATRKVLSKFGAFVRTGARHSIRPRKKISAPGSPPSSHEGSLKRLIYFAYEPARRSVVIGPVPFKEGQAPALLEYGGRTTLVRRGKRVRAHFRGRPFMGPAFEREKPKLPAMWVGSVRR